MRDDYEISNPTGPADFARIETQATMEDMDGRLSGITVGLTFAAAHGNNGLAEIVFVTSQVRLRAAPLGKSTA